MINFTKEQIDIYKNYVNENILSIDELTGRCVICGDMLDEITLPNGPEKEVVCLEHREDFIEDYRFIVEKKEIIDTNDSEVTFEKKDDLSSDKVEEGLSVGEVILLDWITNNQVRPKIPKYFQNIYSINVKRSTHILEKEEYIRLGSPLESINNVHTDKIKKILGEFKLKKVGINLN